MSEGEGFEGSEEFATTATVGKELLRHLPTWLGMYAVLAFGIGLISSSDGSPSIGLALGWAAGVMALVVAAMAAAVIRPRLRKVRLVLSSEGVSRTDHLATVSMAWGDIARIERVAILQTRVSPRRSLGAALLTMVTNPLERRSPESIVGEGAFTPAPTTLPASVRAIEAHHDRLGRSAAGRPLRNIALSEFDPDWRTGRIGAWVRAHRPDLLA